MFCIEFSCGICHGVSFMFCLYSLIFCFVELQFGRKWWGRGVFINLLKLAQWFWCFCVLFSFINPWGVEPQWGLVYLGAWRGKWKELVIGIVHSVLSTKRRKKHTQTRSYFCRKWGVLCFFLFLSMCLFPFSFFFLHI